MFLNAIILLPVFCTAFWALQLIANYKRNHAAQNLLALFMFTAFLLYLCYIPYFNENTVLFIKLLPLYTFTSLMVYPLYYHYVRLLVIDTFFTKKNLLFYIPAIILSISIGLFLRLCSPEEMTSLIKTFESKHLIGNGLPGKAGAVLMLFALSRGVFMALILITLWLNINLIKHYNKQLDDSDSNHEGKQLKYLYIILTAVTVTSIYSMVANVVGIQFFRHSILLIIPSVVTSILLYFIGFMGQKQPRNIILTEQNTVKNHNQAIDAITKKEFEKVLIEKEFYLHINLKISDLCTLLDTNKTYLSAFINTHYGINFSTLVNKLRVDYAVKLIEDGALENHNMQFVATKSGFGSIKSFHRAFKKFNLISPGVYNDSLLKAS